MVSKKLSQFDSFFDKHPVIAFRYDTNEEIGEYKSKCEAAAKHGTHNVSTDLTKRGRPKTTYSRKLQTKIYFKNK